MLRSDGTASGGRSMAAKNFKASKHLKCCPVGRDILSRCNFGVALTMMAVAVPDYQDGRWKDYWIIMQRAGRRVWPIELLSPLWNNSSPWCKTLIASYEYRLAWSRSRVVPITDGVGEKHHPHPTKNARLNQRPLKLIITVQSQYRANFWWIKPNKFRAANGPYKVASTLPGDKDGAAKRWSSSKSYQAFVLFCNLCCFVCIYMPSDVSQRLTDLWRYRWGLSLASWPGSTILGIQSAGGSILYAIKR